ncbi:MAG: hypothetical protein IJZ86_06725 [Bacteroides sp.]|nr:hypothetical protein [Bacteroides sp.]
MDFKQVEELLERYWQCETSVEEEQHLRNFFCNEEVPQHLARYKELFVYQQLQQQPVLDDSFDRKVLATIETPLVKAHRQTLLYRLIPLFKAAAVVAVVAILGSVAQQSLFNEPIQPEQTLPTSSTQISVSPKKTSTEAAVAHDKQRPDSLRELKSFPVLREE